jgi:hypothetical protein
MQGFMLAKQVVYCLRHTASFVFFEMGLHYIAQAGLELAM